MPLNRHQLKLLKETKTKPVIRTDKWNIKDVEYLRSEGLVEGCCVDKPDDFFYQVWITEKGKAVLHEHFIQRVEKLAAFIVSIVALIVSIIALC